MIRAAVLACLLGTSALAQNAGEAAQLAAMDLQDAVILLDEAKDARDRVAALTSTIRAFEAGLSAMRDGLRGASIRELELTRALQAQEAEVAQLLGLLQVMGAQGVAQGALHPDGPLNTVRAGILVSAVTPDVLRRAEALRAEVEEITLLRQLQQEAADQLRDGLAQVQTARTELSQAIADRVDLPRRFTDDPSKFAILIAATETLDGFATGLSDLEDGMTAPEIADFDARRGTLPLPVQGAVVRRFEEADAAGVVRPGIVVATEAQALVTTPTAATVRYRGPLLNYGLVSILEPQDGILLVLAGLDTVFGEPGQVLPEGSPVGLMGGASGDILSQTGERGGNPRPETLYIEVRQGDTPADPLDWFMVN